MKKPGYYSSGEFARMAHVTLRTIRYYDKHDILKPTWVSESGARFYTDEDFARLQQILLLKYLGFSLEDIREWPSAIPITILCWILESAAQAGPGPHEQMQLVEKAIRNTARAIQTDHTVALEPDAGSDPSDRNGKSSEKQYQNASNISARINLHSLYSENSQGWFPWIFNSAAFVPAWKYWKSAVGTARSGKIV